jgi:hypothetical protein
MNVELCSDGLPAAGYGAAFAFADRRHGPPAFLASNLHRDVRSLEEGRDRVRPLRSAYAGALDGFFFGLPACSLFARSLFTTASILAAT